MNSLKEKDIKVFVGGVHKPFQDCRFSLRSKRLFKIRTVGSILSPTSLYFYEGRTQTHRTAVFRFAQNVFLKGGFTQTLTTKCYAFRWVFISVRVCEQAHTASTNKNPVTFVTGFVPFAGMSSIDIEAELNKLIYMENN